MIYRLLFFLILFFGFSAIHAENQKSPHGPKLKIDCTTCHTTNGWKPIKENGYNHNKTKFPLLGQHKMVSCKQCHTTLKFNEASTECVSCHKDIHEGTVGDDCARCHNNNTWLIPNVKKLHQQQGFAMLGSHATADCNRCHTTASNLKFENIRSDCYSCHQFEYESTQKPNHKKLGFGIECQQCHNMVGSNWNSIGKGFDHGFFPLTGGHNIECSSCHWDNFSKEENLQTNCTSCHGVKNSNPIPAHKSKFASFECNECHSINSWTSGIRFNQHDSWGKIYSGKHKGEWSQCIDCHNNNNEWVANCSKCHKFSTGTLP
jgi:hypothetical protein